MTAHIDADALLHAVAHQMHDELARQGVHLDATLVDKAAEAALGAAYGDAHAVELVHRLGTENPQLAAVLGTAFAFLKSHPGFWVGYYALRHHEQPLHPEHPWSEAIERGFGRSEAEHEHHERRLEEHREWHPHHHTGVSAPNFGHTYAHGPRPKQHRRHAPPPPPPRQQGWTPPAPQAPAQQQGQDWTPPATDQGGTDPSADPSAQQPGATFDPATLAAMYGQAPAPTVDPTLAPPAAAPAPGPSTDVSTAGADPRWLKRTVDQWIAQLSATPLPWGVTQAQRTFLMQQLFALALSPTSATAQVVLQQLGQAAAGTEAQAYYGVLWNMLSRAAPPAVTVGWGEHPGEIRGTADHRPAENHHERERLAQETAQHMAWEREHGGAEPGSWRAAHPGMGAPPPLPYDPHRGEHHGWQPAQPRPEGPRPGAPRLGAHPHNSWERWQHIHPGSSYGDYEGWWQQFGQHGASIDPDAPIVPPFGLGIQITSGYHGHGGRGAPRGRRGGPGWWLGWEPFMGPEYVVDQRNELEDAPFSDDVEPEHFGAD